MYIPKSKQIVGGKIAGKLFDLKTGFRYTGPYVQDFKGNFYKGTVINKNSEALEFIPDDLKSKNPLGIFSVFRKPTASDYKKGIFIRYFVKDARSGRVVEIDKKQYLEQRNEAKLYRRTLKIAWYITGNVEDTVINGYVYPGTKAKNLDVIDKAEKELPGIGDQVLKNPAEFVK